MMIAIAYKSWLRQEGKKSKAVGYGDILAF